MRRQFVSNVAFYSTTAVLILIIVLCIGATVKSESRDETQRMENRIQEQQLMSDMKQRRDADLCTGRRRQSGLYVYHSS